MEVRTDGSPKTDAPGNLYSVELSAGIRIEVLRDFDPAELGALFCSHLPR